ncbi:MAG TPA: hypothetical protein VKS20_15210 [Candidatus Acidoferrales bacterium]|nr:hypothetical protein [Candidatus Acidoferrales bacterium]
MKRSGDVTAAAVTLILAVLSARSFALSRARQERSDVPAQAGQPNFTFTRHGKISFEADISRPGARSGSRVVLKETIEVAGVKNAQPWIDFIHAFAGATAQALLDGLPQRSSTKKGKVTVAFALRRDGTLNGPVSLARTSGDASIEAAARVAVAKAAPFHGLPANLPGALAHFRVTFAYNHPPAPTHAGGSQ